MAEGSKEEAFLKSKGKLCAGNSVGVFFNYYYLFIHSDAVLRFLPQCLVNSFK